MSSIGAVCDSLGKIFLTLLVGNLGATGRLWVNSSPVKGYLIIFPLFLPQGNSILPMTAKAVCATCSSYSTDSVQHKTGFGFWPGSRGWDSCFWVDYDSRVILKIQWWTLGDGHIPKLFSMSVWFQNSICFLSSPFFPGECNILKSQWELQWEMGLKIKYAQKTLSDGILANLRPL